MRKSPAILFYTAEFLARAAFMSYENVGRYVMLVCYQHQNGYIPKRIFDKICPDHNEEVCELFAVDENGNYHNEELDFTLMKREEYVASREENGKKGGRPKKSEEVTSKTVKKEESTEKKGAENEEITEKKISEGKTFTEETTHKGEEKEKKTAYGELGNVSLSESEYEKIKEKFPKDYQKRIDDLSFYLSTSGKQYQSHYAVLLNWSRRENVKPEKETPKKDSSFDTDEFFEAALARSNRLLREKCGF